MKTGARVLPLAVRPRGRTALGLRRSLLAACRRLLQWACGVRGHDVMLHVEPQRVCLECTTCGYQTPGWEIASTRSVVRQPVARIVRRTAPDLLDRCA